MNKKISTLVLTTLAVVFFMSGCSSHQIGTPSEISKIDGHPEANTKEEKIFLVATRNDSSNSLSRASDIEESAYFTLQNVAESALERGDKYFAVNAPKAMSNFDGSTITTMEEFVEKCGTSSGGGFASAFDAFGLNTYYCNISGVRIVHAGFMEVAFYKEKPLNVLVWDAEAVLSYLKKEGLYKTYDKKDVEIIESSKLGGGGYWIKNLRDLKQ